MKHLDEEQLQASPDSGARALVAALLRDAVEELKHLEAGGAEALHDFRVALRRLRSATRALRPHLQTSVRRRHERRLRAVARSTARARDAEVQLAWLAQERAAGARNVPAIDLLVRRLEQRRREDMDRASGRQLARFRRLAGKLSRRLALPAQARAPAAAASFGSALAEIIRQGAVDLGEALDAVGGPFEVQQGHAARIAAKRLRYLLEPLRGSPRADATAAVDALKELQDLLGELHDSHVAGDLVAAALVEAAADRARQAHAAILAGDRGLQALRLARRDPVTRGLLALDRRAADRSGVAYGYLAREWLPARKAALLEAVARVVGALAPHPAERAPALRRLLLARLPEDRGPARPLEIETGWMPGAAPPTWLRRVRGPEGIRYFRGEEREAAAPEEIGEGTFAALWPSTEGRRLRKRRHLAADRGRRWSVDEYPDLRLAIAEVGAPPEGEDIRIPRALRPLVVREVTQERGYGEERLAARVRRSRPATRVEDQLSHPQEGCRALVTIRRRDRA
jgi:CHAD domain-containing protein